jgi:recombination protein RecT
MPTTTVQQAAQAAQDSRDVERTQVQTLRTAIDRNAEGFAQALPDHIRPDRFIRAALTAVNVVPRLAECTAPSVIAGLMQAAQLGLEVADVRGQCYLIPRKDNRAGVYKASFQLGYRGMIDLAARSGITVTAEEVCEGDELDYALGSRRHLFHRPNLNDRGDAYAYYAVATFADRREPEFKIMGRDEIARHRDRFAASVKAGSPWVDHFDAMARKTVIRALLNYLPVSVELRDAIHNDAIEATATEVERPVVYDGATFLLDDPDLPPDNVDAATGEIDQMTVVEVPQDEPT